MKYNVVDALERENLGLIKYIEGLKKIIDRQNAEIEKQREILNSYALRYGTVRDQNKKIQKIKTEAYKEFADRLKQVMFNEDFLQCEPSDMADLIDNLVKEMTEGSNGE